ncbi:universal stress protein [Streptomyces sp. HNM0645]|uniref:universal stress protein n=1 Tax=Streptomyces sp. HNM0645 TaxID=2782343 RepID=UPI0024B65E62|nr:universal stress protein [Streptomyces sp. HNM0645]MDI9885018.1 universal stress protein [Streptomyces sp. HNM0645]
MLQHVTAGLDGSAESAAAAEWAAREALLRKVSLRLLLVADPPDPPRRGPDEGDAVDDVLAGTARALQGRHPGLEVRTQLLSGRPPAVLAREAATSELVVLGSRGLGSVRGFLLGSVAMATIAGTDRPVVLVRPGREPRTQAYAEERAYAESPPFAEPNAKGGPRPARSGPAAGASGSVVVGVDVHDACGPVLDFAFGEAALRGGRLRAVHSWFLPPFGRDALALDMALQEMRPDVVRQLRNVLAPWRQKYPSVDVVELTPVGGVSEQLLHAADGAALVVVGRRIRTGRVGARVGPVTHAMIHHCGAPVAVVAHA